TISHRRDDRARRPPHTSDVRCSTHLFLPADDGIRDGHVTGVQTCALPIPTPVRALSAAPQSCDCQSSYGTQAGGAAVLDVAPGVGLPAAEKVRFARGVARLTQWCEVDHRTFDWAPRSL